MDRVLEADLVNFGSLNRGVGWTVSPQLDSAQMEKR